MLGFDKLGAVAHVGESMLSRMRDRKLSLNPQVTTALLSLVDALRKMLSSIEMTGTEGDGDYSDVVAAVTAILEGSTDAAAAPHPQLPRLCRPPLWPPPRRARKGSGNSAHREDGRKRARGRADRRTRSRCLASSTIRVDVGLLDKLMNLVGELVLARNQVLQFTTTTKDATFLRTAQRLNLITTELQEGVMKTRMQPIGNVWNKFPRVVRDLAVELRKTGADRDGGADTELDKTIIEAIKDPLTHLVRNAVDHGIESPEQRARAGKPPEGRLVAAGLP